MASSGENVVQSQERQQQPPQPQQSRRRYHSWSRLRRGKPQEQHEVQEQRQEQQQLSLEECQNKQEQQHEIQAETHICFAKDGSWFQGNISPPHHSVFKISGIRQAQKARNPSRDDQPRIRRSMSAKSTSSASSTADKQQQMRRRSSCSRDSLDSGSCSNGLSSPGGHDTPPVKSQHLEKLSESADDSCSSSLDSELVSAVMKKLDLDTTETEEEEDEEDEAVGEEEGEEDAEDDGSEVFKVTVVDYETGLDYKLDRVKVVRRNSDCEIRSPHLTFSSDKCFRGAFADRVLVNQLGPSFVDRDLRVFRGSVSFRYSYQPCKAVSVHESQWCL